MKGAILNIRGNWAHFKKPETNNNPLTHDFITKTALVGMMGAVLGIEREQMKSQFPLLTRGLLYGVQVVNPVKKISWGFTSRSAIHPTAKGSPKYFEILKEPEYRVAIAVNSENIIPLFADFIESINLSQSIYEPVLGWHNCPADIKIEEKGEFEEKQTGLFCAKCFFSNKHKPDLINTSHFRVGFDKIPTFQNDDFWNIPENYVEVIYPSVEESISIEGEFYNFMNKEKWWLI